MNSSIGNSDAILFDAIQIEDHLQRRQYLDRACGADSEQRREIEILLQVHARAGSFLEHPAVESALNRSSSPDSTVVAQKETLSAFPLDGRLGEFTLIREIAHGGMGVVYEAEQGSLQRRVALKVLPFASVLDKRQLQRFKTEARAAGGLHHPHIVPVHQVGCERGVHFYVMQYIDGPNVAELLDHIRKASERQATEDVDRDATRRTAPAEPAETVPMANLTTQHSTNRHDYHHSVVALGIQAAEALDFAHEHGILHRDIKPSNLMLDNDGELRITDFGLARIEGDSGLTMTGDLMGTLRYMSPENLQGNREVIDGRTDVYSLGITLYEMLTLTPAFEGNDRAELLRKVSFEEPVPLRKIDSSIPVDLETIVLKATAKLPQHRYATSRELADDLQRFVRGEPVLARRATLLTHVVKWAHRNRVLALSFAAAFIGGIVAAAVVVVIRDREGNKIAELVVPDGGSVIVSDVSKTATGRQSAENNGVVGDNALPGLIPHPEKLPGVGRWQLVNTRPGSFLPHDWSFDWSPDGKFITFGDGFDVRIHAVPSLRLTRLYSGHRNSVTSVSWSPDGQWIASASADRTVRLWNAVTGEPGPVLVGHRDRVDAVAWHPDSRRLVSGGRDETAMIWNVNGESVRILPRHPADVSSVAWSPDGELLATGDGSSSDPGHDSLGGTIRIWNRQGDGDQIRLIDSGERVVYSINWSPAGDKILNASFWPTVAQIWNVDGTGPVVLKGHTNAVVNADWSPDGHQVATASWDRTVRLWGADGSVGPVLEGHDSFVLSVKWSPTGEWLASGGQDGIRLWRPDGTGGPVLYGRRPVHVRAWNPDGDRFPVGCHDHTVRLFDSDGSAAEVLEGHTAQVRSVDWNSTGNLIASTSFRDGTLRFWDSDGTARRVIDCQSLRSGSITFSPNGNRVARIGKSPTSRIRLWNLNGTPDADLIGHDGQIYDVVWSPQGDRLASVGLDETLRVWTPDGEGKVILKTGQLNASVDWKPDGTQIACGCDDGQIQLCRPDGRESVLLSGHENRVTRLRWSPDGQWLASGSRDSMVRLWSESGQPVAVLPGHVGTVSGLAWQPHSRQLLSSGLDGTVRLWDTETHSVKWILVVLPDKQSVTLSPEGRLLAGDPAVFEREFAYLLEQPTGSIEIVKPTVFQSRTQTGATTQER